MPAVRIIEANLARMRTRAGLQAPDGVLFDLACPASAGRVLNEPVFDLERARNRGA